MTELLLDELDVLSHSDHDCRERVPQVVEPDPGQLRTLQGGVELAGHHVLWVDRIAGFILKDQDLGFSIRPLLVKPEDSNQLIRYKELTARRFWSSVLRTRESDGVSFL